jgi:hypothetical protein
MKKPRTKNISSSVLKDALSVTRSIYGLNAASAVGYLFNPNMAGKAVSNGMFYNNSPYDREEFDAKRWTGYIDFATKTLKDLDSEEVLDLSTINL